MVNELKLQGDTDDFNALVSLKLCSINVTPYMLSECSEDNRQMSTFAKIFQKSKSTLPTV